MRNTTIETPSFMEATVAPLSVRPLLPHHDIAEVAIGFGRQVTAQRRAADFGATTFGDLTFRRVDPPMRNDPLREPLKVADQRLQVRLEELCETLRAKY